MAQRKIRFLAAAAAAVLALGAVRTAAAGDNWLEVAPFFSPVPGKAKVYLTLGDGWRESEPVVVRSRDLYPRMLLVSATGQRDVTAEIREDQQPLAVLSAGARAMGTFVLALDAAPRDLELPAERFQGFLLKERLIDALMWRAGTGKEDAPGRERYSRHMKAVVQIGPKLDDVVTRPVGQDLEIVPLSHPYGLTQGQSLTVQVLYQGRPLPGRAITAANRFRGDVVKKTVRTDAAGKATFAVGRAGDWMVRLVHAEPATGDVDFRTYWASMTFSLPG